MSDLHGHDDKHGAGLQGPHGDDQAAGHGAGHEMDVPPTKELFNIVWGLGALTLLSLVTCVQLFNNQRDDLMAERGREAGQVLTDYRQNMDAVTKGSGKVSFKDSTGAEVSQAYVPLAVARELVLSKPERLLAAPAPRGWMHPDDIAAGAQAGGTAAGAAGGAAAGAAPTGIQAPPGSGQVPPDTVTENPPAPGPGGPIVPGREGTLAPTDGHSVPGQPAADPRIDGAASNGAPGTGTPPANSDLGPGATPGSSAPGVRSPTGVPGPATARPGDAGKAGADAGQSGDAKQPAGTPAPAAPTPAPSPAPSR